jgi:phosphoglycerol transferase MdoB-like AlkP superfamily enzyme
MDLTLPERYAIDNYKDLIIDYPSYHSLLPDKRPLTNVPDMSKKAHGNQKNVIMIVLESVRAYETSLFDAEYSLTPNLDKISKKGVSLPNFYASNRQTVKAEQALLCSAIDYMGDAPYALKHGVFNGDCLPKILAQNGYETHWFHGYTKEFFNRKQYHKSIGFENIYAKEEFEADGYDSANDIGWGVPDTILFDTVFKKLESLDKESKPFFMEVLTLTNHQPFDWDYGELTLAPNRYDKADHKYKNYQKGIIYTDKALGQFWDKFKRSKFAENTVVIITADHGVPFYPSEKMAAAEKREILFRIPFILIDPDTTEPAVITTQLSQLDVAPTVLSMLDISSTNAFIGRPFYGDSATQSDRPILLLSSNGLSVRYGDLSCNPVGEMCTAGDNTCKQVGALQCLTHDDSLLKYGQQAINYHEYLKLALETGFVL